MAFWLVAISVGIRGLWLHSTLPGSAAAAATVWPGQGLLPLSGDLPTLVMILHPHCPCSRASIGEMDALLSRFPGRMAAYALLASADDAALNRCAKSVEAAGMTAVRDPDGEIVRRFGATTSGYVLLYDVEGNLQFSGGVTPSRGHRGANEGIDAIAAIIEGRRPLTQTSATFGCSIAEVP